MKTFGSLFGRRRVTHVASYAILEMSAHGKLSSNTELVYKRAGTEKTAEKTGSHLETDIEGPDRVGKSTNGDEVNPCFSHAADVVQGNTPRGLNQSPAFHQ